MSNHPTSNGFAKCVNLRTRLRVLRSRLSLVTDHGNSGRCDSLRFCAKRRLVAASLRKRKRPTLPCSPRPATSGQRCVPRRRKPAPDATAVRENAISHFPVRRRVRSSRNSRIQFRPHDHALLSGRVITHADENRRLRRASIHGDMGHVLRNEQVIPLCRNGAIFQLFAAP